MSLELPSLSHRVVTVESLYLVTIFIAYVSYTSFNYTYFILMLKPTRCINFSNLYLE